MSRDVFAWQRQQLRAYLRAQERLTAQRPNEPPEDRCSIPSAELCGPSPDGRHDYSSLVNDDPAGSGLRSVRCRWCCGVSPRSQARIDAWRQRRKEMQP